MKYAHVCYRINEIDRSIEFYCGALGFKELKRYPIRDEAVNIYVAPEGSENTPLELTFNFGRTEDYDIGTGYGHIAYHVEDLDGTLERLSACSPRSRRIRFVRVAPACASCAIPTATASS